MTLNVAFIGSAGVPNTYGGFEMFLESCAPELACRYNRVLVTCDSTRYRDRTRDWQGVERVFVPVKANGASSVFHDVLAFFSVFFLAQVIIVLGVSGGIFFPLFRLLCSLTGKRLIVNVDGIEWRRAKFSRMRRLFLLVSDRLAQRFAHRVVVDNEALRPFLIPSVRKSAALIAYPGDHVLNDVPTANASPERRLFLTICRIEPENNCHVLIEAFAQAGVDAQYVFIGNWNASAYGRELRERFHAVPGLEMRDAEYDKTILATLRTHCSVYLHGHSVGGTNPSLVEMLFYDCSILAYDCGFNRTTAGDAAAYFVDQKDLSGKLASHRSRLPASKAAVRALYTRARICGAYVSLIADVLGQDVGSEALAGNTPASPVPPASSIGSDTATEPHV